MSPPNHILDSHIHLWPASASNLQGHSWMTPGHHLTRQYGIQDYLSSAASRKPDGFVYVETDRALPPLPEVLKRFTSSSSSSPSSPATKLENGDATWGEAEDEAFQTYVAEPLREVEFLRRIVEDDASNEDEGHGAGQGNGKLMRGAVAWAPVQLGRKGVQRFLELAEERAGSRAWKVVKGFRFLLQGIRDEAAFRELALGRPWIEGLKELGRRGYSFDVGVDERQGGVWQLEVAGEMIRKLREEEGSDIVLILNHLCKPNVMAQRQSPSLQSDFSRWTAAVTAAAQHSNVYMKLSGAFSEIGEQDASSPWPASLIVDRMAPWLDVVFRAFPPERIMFGSDWPVCNVGGPGDALSWASWKGVVELALERYKVGEEQRDRIWFGTAVEAYRLPL